MPLYRVYLEGSIYVEAESPREALDLYDEDGWAEVGQRVSPSGRVEEEEF